VSKAVKEPFLPKRLRCSLKACHFVNGRKTGYPVLSPNWLRLSGVLGLPPGSASKPKDGKRWQIA